MLRSLKLFVYLTICYDHETILTSSKGKR